MREKVVRQLSIAGLSLPPNISYFALHLRKFARASPLLRHHAAPQVGFLGKDPTRYVHIFNPSDINGLERLISTHRGAPIRFPHHHASPRGNLGSLPLGKEAMKALRKFYAQDFRAYGEFFEDEEEW